MVVLKYLALYTVKGNICRDLRSHGNKDVKNEKSLIYKQRNNISRSLHFLLHYFFITARLGSERFLFKILLYNIEQHINQNVQNRRDMIFKRQKQEKNVKNGQRARIWVQVFLWEIKVKTKLAWAVHVTKSLHLHFDKIQFKISLWWTLCGDRKRKKIRDWKLA